MQRGCSSVSRSGKSGSVLRLLTDEHVNPRIAAGLRRSEPPIGCVTVQEAGLRTASDAALLEWAAANGYVVVSHDYATMPDEAWARVAAGLPMPGLILVPGEAGIGAAVAFLHGLAAATEPADLDSRVFYANI